MTTTVSKSFTSVAVGNILRMQAAELLTFALSGTYAASLQVEEAEASEMSWRRISPVYSTANATVAFTYAGKENMSYRWRCVAYTSGTAVTTAIDEDKTLQIIRDRFGNIIETLKQSGIDVTLALTVAGAAVGSAVAPLAGGATRTLTSADDAKTILLDTAAGTIITLPAASGSGVKFRFVNSVAPTSNSHKINTLPTTDVFIGWIQGVKQADGTINNWNPGATDNQIKMNGGTTGALGVGDYIEVQDVAAGLWEVSKSLTLQNGTVATPFFHV